MHMGIRYPSAGITLLVMRDDHRYETVVNTPLPEEINARFIPFRIYNNVLAFIWNYQDIIGNLNDWHP